jgi:hypothetical protein
VGTTIDPPADDPGGDPGTPGYTPPTDPNAVFAIVVTSSNCTIAASAIAAAGGPWAAFTVRVTPVNDWGAGTPAQVDWPVAP